MEARFEDSDFGGLNKLGQQGQLDGGHAGKRQAEGADASYQEGGDEGSRPLIVPCCKILTVGFICQS